MKVLRTIGGLDPAFGGPSESAIHAAIATHRAGAKTTFAVPVAAGLRPEETPALQRLQAEGIETRIFPLTGWAGGAARRYGISAALGRWLRRTAPLYDVVHCHSAWVAPTFSALRLAEPRPARLLSPHEGLTAFDIEQSSSVLTRAVKRRLRPKLLSGFDLVIVSSDLEARDSLPVKASIATRPVAVPHAVFDDSIRMPQPRGAVARDSAPVVGFIGRLHEKKNVGMLIRALGHMKLPAKLLVAGDGAEGDRLRRLAVETGVAARIEWLGFVSGGAKADFFARVDMLAMPSQYECFGMAAAEAMCAGLPVLVGEETGVAATVARFDCGMVTNPAPEAVAAALDSMLHNAERLEQYSRRAATAARATFSYSAHGKAVMGHYEAALAVRARRS